MSPPSMNRPPARPKSTGPLGLAALLVAVATLVPLGCGGGDEPSSSVPGGSAAGTVDVEGSSTVFRISDRAREGFAQVDPKVNVIVGKSGTGGGFNKYLAGEVDIIDASRPAKPEEETQAKSQGIDWTRFLVGYDGIAVVVNKKNDFVQELSVADLKRLFEPGSKVRTWKDLNPAWPDRKVILYTPDKDSGTFEYFTEAIVDKSRPKQQRDDVQASSDDNTLVRGVSDDADAIGYFGYAYYSANAATLRALPIKAKDDAPAVAPDPETILKKTYTPLARPLYIYVKKKSMSRPAVEAFVRYYLKNIESLATKAGYVSPTAEDRAANEAALAAPAAGGPPA